MKYFFILGNHPTISVAEIFAVLPGAKFELPQPNVLLLGDCDIKSLPELMHQLGGTIKTGIVKTTAKHANTPKLAKLLSGLMEPPAAHKFPFGLSIYGADGINTKILGMEIKSSLRARGISCRWVTSREKTLSSVVVEQNKLLSQGIEFVIINQRGTLLIGQTLAVQPFKELSFRDYGRPARDDKSGMLPPKLALIMLNLSQAPKRGIILDPFCGSGTILSEAALQGYQNIVGTDNSSKAVSDSKKNIEWIEKKFKVQSSLQAGGQAKFEIFQTNVKQLSKKIKPSSIDAIITEPYLGPQRAKIDLKKIIPELNQLNTNALKEFYKALKPNGRVVMIWPEFHITRDVKQVNPDLKGFKIINPLSESLHKYKSLKLTSRQTMIYSRPGQRVWREIVVLQKK